MVTVKLLERVGVPHFLDFAASLGLPLRAQNGLSLALGTGDVTLDDLVRAYAALAAGGTEPQARTILRIHDRRTGTWIDQATAVSPVMDPGAAFVTTQMLKDVLTYGTAKNLHRFAQTRPCAGKTGTTETMWTPGSWATRPSWWPGSGWALTSPGPWAAGSPGARRPRPSGPASWPRRWPGARRWTSPCRTRWSPPPSTRRTGSWLRTDARTSRWSSS